MGKQKKPCVVNIREGEEVKPGYSLAIVVPMGRRQNMAFCGLLGWILGNMLIILGMSLTILGLTYILQRNSLHEFTLRKYEAPHNLPNISSSQKSLTDGDGNSEVVCRQRNILPLLKCLATANKLHGTEAAQKNMYPEAANELHGTEGAQEEMYPEDPMQYRDTLPIKIKLSRDTTSYKTGDSYPAYIDILPESFSPCKFPSLRTADIWCKVGTNSVYCKSYCVYGSTYEEGIVRTHVCKQKEKKWSTEFEECKPFLDCTPEIASPGKIKCHETGVVESTTCEISCQANEAEGDMSKYECKSDGTWDPPLPSCVALRGMSLVKAPNVTKHIKLSYPKDEEVE